MWISKSLFEFLIMKQSYMMTKLRAKRRVLKKFFRFFWKKFIWNSNTIRFKMQSLNRFNYMSIGQNWDFSLSVISLITTNWNTNRGQIKISTKFCLRTVCQPLEALNFQQKFKHNQLHIFPTLSILSTCSIESVHSGVIWQGNQRKVRNVQCSKVLIFFQKLVVLKP